MSAKKKPGLPNAVAKKAARAAAYKAQAQTRKAGDDLRNTAGREPAEDYAAWKVEGAARDAASTAGNFTFRSAKIPYAVYRRMLQKRLSEKNSLPEEGSIPCPSDTAEPAAPHAAARRQQYRRKAIQNQAARLSAQRHIDAPAPAEPIPLPSADRRQQLRKRQILVKAVRKKLAATEAQRTAAVALPPPKLPQTTSKPVRERLQRMAHYLFRKIGQLVVHAARAVASALLYLAGAGGMVLVLALVIGAAAAILGSPLGILFADESNDPRSIPIADIVLEANTELGEAINDLVAAHPECSSTEFHYEYEDGHTWASYWPEVLAVFAVQHNLNGDDDVIVMDREKADLLMDTFWTMHLIDSRVETIEISASSEEEGGEGKPPSPPQVERILHITIRSKTVDTLAADYHFTQDQCDILHLLLSDEMRPMLVALCGPGLGAGTGTPPAGDGTLLWPLPGHTTLTTHFGEADAFGNPGHRGIDIPAPGGTPILAAHSGTVLISGWNNSFGNQVLIDDGAGLSTRYAHMTATAVSPGQPVTAGQVIGYVGSTGDSTGNHLHFEVSVGGVLTDPLGYVKVP